MSDRILKWADKLHEASRGSISEFQEALVAAISELGNDAYDLGVSDNDWSWATKLHRERKRVRQYRRQIARGGK